MKTPFQRLLYRYTYDLKLKTKLVISHTIPLLVPTAVLTLFLFLQIHEIIKDDAVRSEQALSAQTTTSIETLVSHAVHASDTLCANTVFQAVFLIPSSEAESYVLSESRINNLSLTAGSLLDRSLISDVQIYYETNPFGELSQYNSPSRPLFFPASQIGAPLWNRLFSGSLSDSLLCSASDLTGEENSQPGKLAYVTRLSRRPSANPHTSGQASAYVVIYFSQEAFQGVLRQNSTIPGGVSYLVSSKNTMIAASDPALAETFFLPPSEFTSRIGVHSSYQLTEVSGAPVYAACFPISGTDWYMVSVIPETHISRLGWTMLLHFGIIYGFLGMFSLFVAIHLSGSIADRLITIAVQMEKVRSGRPQPLPSQSTGCDEIGVLTDTYNYMTEEINLLMDRQEQNAEDLRRAQFRALQAQINPHFLYNTLDMINWLSQSGRTREVTQAIQALSRFYKLTLSKKELLNTVSEEIEHVSLYMELQNMRFDNGVSFVVDVPEELGCFTLPKLTFQPLVENGLLHGIMMTEQKTGTILLTGWREGKDICFLISDDGAGMEPEKLERLLLDPDTGTGGLASEAAGADRSPQNVRFGTDYHLASRRIGVYNTHRRLQSLYGPGYGLSYSSAPGQGTTVTIRIPARPVAEGEV